MTCNFNYIGRLCLYIYVCVCVCVCFCLCVWFIYIYIYIYVCVCVCGLKFVKFLHYVKWFKLLFIRMSYVKHFRHAIYIYIIYLNCPTTVCEVALLHIHEVYTYLRSDQYVTRWKM